MSAAELLGCVVPPLQQAGLEFMIAGSFASTYHGEPRTTHDIAIVIEGSLSALETFVTSLDSETTYVDLDVARDAHTRRGQFKFVDMTSGWKVEANAKSMRRAPSFGSADRNKKTVSPIERNRSSFSGALGSRTPDL